MFIIIRERISENVLILLINSREVCFLRRVRGKQSTKHLFIVCGCIILHRKSSVFFSITCKILRLMILTLILRFIPRSFGQYDALRVSDRPSLCLSVCSVGASNSKSKNRKSLTVVEILLCSMCNRWSMSIFELARRPILACMVYSSFWYSKWVLLTRIHAFHWLVSTGPSILSISSFVATFWSFSHNSMVFLKLYKWHRFSRSVDSQTTKLSLSSKTKVTFIRAY